MIVLKETQNKVLDALQSVADIVTRRYTSPIMINEIVAASETAGQIASRIFRIALGWVSVSSKALNEAKFSFVKPAGFFSSVKTNLRNAP